MNRDTHVPVQFQANSAAFKLGQTDQDKVIYSAAEYADAATLLTQQARREIRLFTHHLDGALYDNITFIEALSQFARQAPQAHVQILIQSARNAVQSNSRFVELCRKLTSHITVKRVNEEHAAQTNLEFLLADQIGFVMRKNFSEEEASVNFCSPLESKKLGALFTEIWDLSALEQEFRQLNI